MIIAKLAGEVDSVYGDHCILMVSGVGYAIYATTKTLGTLQVGQSCALYVEHLIRQDFQQLCGFIDASERSAFRALLNVQGVGARVGLAILSVMNPSELAAAISSKDKTMLSRADGVGPKLAERLVLELKDKVFSFGSDNIVISAQPQESSATEDALQGLIALGYNRGEAYNAVREALKHNASMGESVQELIRNALQRLSRV